jgi:hypothetical protein
LKVSTLTNAMMLMLVYFLRLLVRWEIILTLCLIRLGHVLFVVVPVILLTAAKLFLILLASRLRTSSFVLISIGYMDYLESLANLISVHSAAILSAPSILLSDPLVLDLLLGLLVVLPPPAPHPSTINSINIDERSFGSVFGSSGGASSPSTSSIYKLMKIQTKAIADSNRLVSARLSSLEEFIGGTGNDGDGDDASGGTEVVLR